MFELPIFPLNTVLFPGMPLRLHIFEERYQYMMKQVLDSSRTFGVCLIKNGMEALGPIATPFPTGCTARITQVEPLEDGQMNITVVGDERFHIVHAGSVGLYLNAFVESIPLKSHHSIAVVRDMRILRQRVLSYLALLAQSAEANPESNTLDIEIDLTGLQLPEDPMMLIYLSAALLQVPAVEKQPLLEAETASTLLEQIQRLYRRELAVLPSVIDIDEDKARSSAWVN